MNTNKITVVVLTYNRPDTLRLTLQSVLAQDYDAFDVMVLDNCSTDQTPEVVQQFQARDPRVRYVRNDRNIGILRNWNKGLTLNRSPFVSIFHDDDLMLPGFLRRTVEALESHPATGFALVQAQFIDENGNFKGLQDVGDLPEGLMSGLDLLELWVNGRGIGIFPATIVLRASAAREAGNLESPHTRGYADIDFYNRIAARHDVFFIRAQLVQYRVHESSDTELLNRSAGATPWYGELATKIDALAPLLRSPRAADAHYRQWLADRLLYLHAHASAAIHPSIPAMYHDWNTRIEIAQEQLETIVPAGDSLLLVDDAQLGLHGPWRGRRQILPFLERDGTYWGAPEESEQAIAELERVRRERNARWLVIAWPCFWWLERYARFAHYLARTYPRRLDTPHVVVYELQDAPPDASQSH